MANERLRQTMIELNLSEAALGGMIGVDPKTVQRWITQGRLPHRRTAARAADSLKVEAAWLWPQLTGAQPHAEHVEVVAFYPHRAAAPKRLWLDLITAAEGEIGLLAYASLFLPEENPEAIEIVRAKAAQGVRVRIALGDPESPEVALRGQEERLFDAIPARVRMALAYYQPLVGLPGISFRLHRTTLYNSIFLFDDEMLVNQHVYGAYGYVAPLLHLRRAPTGDLFDTYVRSFERVWEESYPISSPSVD